MIYTALILGLLGSCHCIGMCGPIAFLLPVDKKNTAKCAFQLMSYHIGRIITYTILGFVFGIIGNSLNLFGVQQQISIIIGILMIVSILIPTKLFYRYNLSKPIYRIVSKIRSIIGVQFKNKSLSTFFTIGFFNALLPCGLVYMAIFGALATSNALYGSLYMVIFGLGTVPLMTITVYIGNVLNQKVKQYLVKVIPLFIVIIGLLFVLRGLGLNIPYLSPSQTVTVEKVSSTHNCH